MTTPVPSSVQGTLLISDARGRVSLALLAKPDGEPIGAGRREWLAVVDPNGVVTLTPAQVVPATTRGA